MLGEILNPAAPAICPATVERTLPKRLLFSIFARIGGSGLDTDAFESLRASYRGGVLGRAIAYDNRQNEIPASLIHSLRWHPGRLIASSGNRTLRPVSQLVWGLFALASDSETVPYPVNCRDSNLASRWRESETRPAGDSRIDKQCPWGSKVEGRMVARRE